jgi:hypothetical protein
MAVGVIMEDVLKTSDSKSKCRAGSIMLETVIVIPLYMMLLGGMLWIGELMMAKQKLVIADRYAAWNIGNRYRELPDTVGLKQEVQDRFFVNNEATVHAFGDNISPPPNKWAVRASAGVPVDSIPMPLWIQGFLAVGETMWQVADAEKIPTNVLLNGAYMRGRDVLDGAHDAEPTSAKIETHMVLMRSGSTLVKQSRENSIAYNWAEVEKAIGQRWPFD